VKVNGVEFLSSVIVSCFRDKLVAEAGDGSGTQRKGNALNWEPLPSNGY
jgi:hypothetical protein